MSDHRQFLKILRWEPVSVGEVSYLNARSGGGTELRTLAVTCALVARLPNPLEGLILTADLQGREWVMPEETGTDPYEVLGREGPRLLGEVVAQELARLSTEGILPDAARTGVILAGDFWAEPGSSRRGGLGDVGPVWDAFRRRFRWVAGVLGNHDKIDDHQRGIEDSDFGGEIHLLDGQVITLDGLTIGGISGIIGKPSKLLRRSEDEYLALLEKVLESRPELVVLHEAPALPGCKGRPSVRTVLNRCVRTVLVCGHCYWGMPIQSLAGGTQVCNVDSRVLVLRACD